MCLMFNIRLYFSHDTEEVASPQFLDILLAEALGTELAGKVDDFRSVSATDDTTIAIKVGTYAYMVDTCHADHVHDVAYGILNGGPTFFA